MDAEALKTLGSLLLWGALFFFMMRFGCGAHTMGGHGHHGGHSKEDEGTAGPAKDPVCGMTVDPQSAAAASVHGGRTHYFCSTSCRDKFEQAPEKYAGVPGPTQGGHHHG